MEMTLHRDVAAPAERVWALITDLEGSPGVLSAVSAVERIDDGDAFGVGTRWRETREMLGGEAVEEMEVTALDPGRSYVAESESHGIRYRSTLAVEPRGDGQSRIRMSFVGEPQGLVARVMGAIIGRLFAGATREALQQDLDDLARAAETGRVLH